MPLPFLHTASGTYDLPAIMRRAWTRARAELAISVRLGFSSTLRAEFAKSLRQVWDEARSARALAAWQAEQAVAYEAAKALDARTREIMDLRFARALAEGIDNSREHFATVRAIETRLSALNA